MATRLSLLLLFVCACLVARSALAVTVQVGGIVTLTHALMCPDEASATAVGKDFEATNFTDEASLKEFFKVIDSRHCDIGQQERKLVIDATPAYASDAVPNVHVYVVAAVLVSPLKKVWLIIHNAEAVDFATPDRPAHWGAMAIGEGPDGAAASAGAVDQPTAGKAIDAAVVACVAKGVPGCGPVTVFNKGCAYITYGKSPNGHALGFGTSAASALKFCQDNGGADCKTPEEYCNAPS